MHTMPKLNAVYENLASRGKTPQVSIQSIKQVNNKAFKVVAAVYNIDNEGDFAVAVADLTEGKGRMIPKSFNMKGRIAIATIVANAQSKPLDASFQMVTASTAADASGTIWRVESDNGKKRVVLESCDDLGQILQARRAARGVFANPVEGFGITTASVHNNDLVRYVDADRSQADWGFAFRTEAGLTVIGADLIPRMISYDDVVASIPRAKVPGEAAKACPVLLATAKLDAGKLSEMMTYLKKSWATSPMAEEMLSKYRKLAINAK